MQVPRGYHSQTLLNDTSFVLGGSWSGGVGGKSGEIFQNGEWKLLSDAPVLSSMVTPDQQGVEKGEYVQ